MLPKHLNVTYVFVKNSGEKFLSQWLQGNTIQNKQHTYRNNPQ